MPTRYGGHFFVHPGAPHTLIAIAITHADLADSARQLAVRLQLPQAELNDIRFSLKLVLTPERLELRQYSPQAPGPVYVDFVHGQMAYRRRHGGGRKQAVAQAIGIKAGQRPRVLDATAGLGRDAFVLAELGCHVHMLERQPVIAALLQDGLTRATRDAELGLWIDQRLTLTVADSREFIHHLPTDQRPDVIYLDPMYPEREKTSLVKKAARALRLVVGDDPDAEALLSCALARARQRIVVKRPRYAPHLEQRQPSFSIDGKATRFDVYLS